MTESDFRKRLTNSGGDRTYFKAEAFSGAYLFMIEPKVHHPSEVNPHASPKDADYEKKKTRPVTIADLTIFQTPEHLEAGLATVITDAAITQPYLALDLADSLGGIEVKHLRQKPNSPGRKPSWVWRRAEGNVMDLVEAYYNKREAETDAALAELDALVAAD